MYRIRQGIRALLAWARPEDKALAASVLSPELMALFQTMRRSERLHSLNVLRGVQAQGQTDPALYVAALLHDVGKTRAPFFLWERVLVVLAKAAVPRLARRWGEHDATGKIGLLDWRRPFMINVQHPHWGAEMVEAAGAVPMAVALIDAHQRKLGHPPETEMERLLVALQAADDAN